MSDVWSRLTEVYFSSKFEYHKGNKTSTDNTSGAEDSTVKNAKPENWQASTKLLTLSPQLSEVWKFSFLIKGDETTHKIVVLEKDFLRN